MALEFNPNIYPAMGYIFVEADGTRFRGSSWEDLTQKVAEYRSQRGGVGDVRGDVIRQNCKKQPAACRDNAPEAPKKSPRTPIPDAPRPIVPPGLPGGSGNIMARVSKWLNHLLDLKRKNSLAFVPAPEARRRALVCSQCPKQVALSSNCGGCMTTLKFVKGQILAGQAPVDKLVLSCSVLAEDQGVGVHLVSPASSDPALPANCWRKNG